MSEWQGLYSTAQASRLLRVPVRTLNDWREQGIITRTVSVVNAHGQLQDEGYSYADLTIIKLMRALRDDQLDLKSVFVALHHLFARLGPPSTGWASAHVYIVGSRVYAEQADEWDVTAATQFGQRVERRVFGDMFEELRKLEEPGAILVPENYRRYVEINPSVMGGAPVVRGTRVPTSILASLQKKGRSLGTIVRLYRPLTKKYIENALAFEDYLSQPISTARPSTT